MTDAELARDVADRAGALLLEIRRGALAGKALCNEGDRAANALILDALSTARPEDGVLSEERACDGSRLAKSRVWIVDPLDGTREYGEGRDDWAVHVALAIDGEPVTGAVALPALGLTFATDAPPPLATENAPIRMVVSRTRPAPEALAVAEALGAALVPMGSAGAKAMAVLRGEAHIYLHTGGQHEWDNCAPVAVALAAGLHASRIDGSPLTYNHADAYLPDLLICHPHRVAQIFELLRSAPSARA